MRGTRCILLLRVVFTLSCFLQTVSPKASVSKAGDSSIDYAGSGILKGILTKSGDTYEYPKKGSKRFMVTLVEKEETDVMIVYEMYLHIVNRISTELKVLKPTEDEAAAAAADRKNSTVSSHEIFVDSGVKSTKMSAGIFTDLETQIKNELPKFDSITKTKNGLLIFTGDKSSTFRFKYKKTKKRKGNKQRVNK